MHDDEYLGNIARRLNEEMQFASTSRVADGLELNDARFFLAQKSGASGCRVGMVMSETENQYDVNVMKNVLGKVVDLAAGKKISDRNIIVRNYLKKIVYSKERIEMELYHHDPDSLSLPSSLPAAAALSSLSSSSADAHAGGRDSADTRRCSARRQHHHALSTLADDSQRTDTLRVTTLRVTTLPASRHARQESDEKSEGGETCYAIADDEHSLSLVHDEAESRLDATNALIPLASKNQAEHISHQLTETLHPLTTLAHIQTKNPSQVLTQDGSTCDESSSRTCTVSIFVRMNTIKKFCMPLFE